MALDCPKAGPLLRVKLESTEMIFDLPDPSAVEVSSSRKNRIGSAVRAFEAFSDRQRLCRTRRKQREKQRSD